MLSDDQMNPLDPALKEFVSAQGPEAFALRSHPIGTPPWPDPDDPILSYLCAKAVEIHDENGLRSALIWLATHAYFEGGIAEVARSTRHD